MTAPFSTFTRPSPRASVSDVARIALALAAVAVAAVAADSTAAAISVHPIRPVGVNVLAPSNGTAPSGTGSGGSGTGNLRRQLSNGIAYHNGPVMLGSVGVYYIFYGNWGTDTAPAILTDFATNLGGSLWYNIETTYAQAASGGPYVTNSVVYRGSTSVAYPYGTSLTDSAIASVVANAINSHALPLDGNAVYFVLTSSDVTASSGFCTAYCGWHTYQTVSGTAVKYAFVGNAARCPSACAAQSSGPNGNAGADGMASVVAHELVEAVSDPQLNGWYDGDLEHENGVSAVHCQVTVCSLCRAVYVLDGCACDDELRLCVAVWLCRCVAVWLLAWSQDKCAWSFGSTYTASNGATANVRIGGRDFLLQQNWVNAAGGYCALAWGSGPSNDNFAR